MTPPTFPSSTQCSPGIGSFRSLASVARSSHCSTACVQCSRPPSQLTNRSQSMSLINFKGRVSFRQYLKGKPYPWGIKVFVLSDSKTGYLQRVCVYYGKETQIIDNGNPHTVRIIQTLVELLHKGYDLYVDRKSSPCQ